MNIKSFLQECHEKEVIKKLTFYVVTSWLLIQVATSIWEPLGLPAESVTILIILLLIGFPINMYLVWVYHLRSLEDIKPKTDENGDPIPGKFKQSAFKKMYFSSISALSLVSVVIILFVIDNKFITETDIQPIKSSDQIAILKFGNNTGIPEKDLIGKMAVDWIAHGITENKVAQVISPEIVDKYEKVLKASLGVQQDVDLLQDYLLPEKVISGNYFIRKDKLIFRCSVQNGDLSKTFMSFKPIECDAENPLECIESLNQLVLGYLSTSDKGILNLQESPPKFEAYQYVQLAKDNIGESDIYLDYLNKAIKVDSNYFYPKILRVGHYYNEGEFKKADSVLKLVKPFSEKQKRQNNLIRLYEAVLDGQYDKIVDYLTFEYNFTPFDLETNQSLMVVTQQFINKPEDVDTLFNAIPALGLDVKDCVRCEYRVFVKVLSDIELGNYEEAIDILNQVEKSLDSFYLKKHLITAYVRKGDFDQVDRILEDINLEETENNIKDAYLFTGKEFLMLGQKEKADSYFDRISQAESPGTIQYDAFAAYYSGDYETAAARLSEINKSDPEDPEILSKLAVCFKQMSDETQSDQYLEQLRELSARYQFGEVDYALAQYYSSMDEKNETYKHLLKAVSQGLRFKYDTFQNDPHFSKYREDPGFERILTFWH